MEEVTEVTNFEQYQMPQKNQVWRYLNIADGICHTGGL